MFETYYINGVPFEVDVNEVEDFLANNPTATKTPTIPSVQTERIMAPTIEVEQPVKVQEAFKEDFDKFFETHGTSNPDEVIAKALGTKVFTEQNTLIQNETFPELPQGFMLEGYDFSNSNTMEGPRQIVINQGAEDSRSNFESKFALMQDSDNAIISTGDNYLSVEDLEVSLLRQEGKDEKADELAEKLGYKKLFDDKDNVIGFIPKNIYEESEEKGNTTPKDVLEEERRNIYHRLISTINIAYQNSAIDENMNTKGIAGYLDTFGSTDVFSATRSRLLGYDPEIIKSLKKFKTVIDQGEIGDVKLIKLPATTASAKAYNKALEDFAIINRALQVNANLAALPEQNFILEALPGVTDNDQAAEGLTQIMDGLGYSVDVEATNREGSSATRDLLEGGRDVAAHLTPLVASIALTKKIPLGQGKNVGTAIDKAFGGISRWSKAIGPQSRFYRNAIDLTVGGLKETVVLGLADIPGERIFGLDPFVYNDATGEFSPLFPFALGVGNVAAGKIVNKIRTTKNLFTPMMSFFSKSETAGSLAQMNLTGTIGTATMFFAEGVSLNANQLAKTGGFYTVNNLTQEYIKQGYNEVEANRMATEDVKLHFGRKKMFETYIGMIMFSSLSPSLQRNSLSKLATGMRNDILNYPSGLTTQVRLAAKSYNVKVNKKGEFNLQDINNERSKKLFNLNKVSKDKNLEGFEAEVKKQKEKIEAEYDLLMSHNDYMFAKKLAKSQGVYRQSLTNTFDIVNKLKTNQKMSAKDIDRIANLSNVEIQFLKAKFQVPEGSDFAKMIDNKVNVYREIIKTVGPEGRRLNLLSPKVREQAINEYLNQAEINGEINRLTLEITKKPHLAEVNKVKIKELKEELKISTEQLIKNEKLYDKILKDKFKTEVEFSKLMARELGAGFNVLGENQYNKLEGVTKNSEGFYDRSKNQIYINKDRALKVRQLGTPLHEITHAILKDSLKETYTDSDGVKRTRVSKEGMVKIDQFLNKLTGKERDLVEKRIEEEYKFVKDSNGNFVTKANGDRIVRAKNEYYEEYLTAFGDVLKNKEVVESPGLTARLKSYFEPILKQAGFKNIDVSTKNGEGLYNMIKAIQKSSETGVIDRAILDAVKGTKQVTGKNIAESKTVSAEMKQASENIDRIYKEKGIEGYNEIIEAIKGKVEVVDPITGKKEIKKSKDFIDFYTKIHEGRANYQARKKDLYDAMAYDPTYGVLGSIISYNPTKGTTMAQHILGRLKQGKHIDVANKILGKDQAGQFTKSTDAPDARQVAAKQKTAEELLDEKMAKKAEAELPNFRKSLKVKGETGISKELVETIKESTIKSFFFTKTGPAQGKKFKQEITKNFADQLKVPIAKMMGGGPKYETFLRENYENIIKKGFIDTKFFVDIESQTPRKDRVFTEVEIESMSVKETDKAIKEERVPRTTSRTAGNTLWKFKDPGLDAFVKFYTPPPINPATGKKSGLKGTRKDKLAEQIGIKLASDMAATVLRIPEVMAKLQGVRSLETSKEIQGVEKELGKEPVRKDTRAEAVKIAEAKNEAFDNYIVEVTEILKVDPDRAFSFTADVKELRQALKEKDILDVIDVKTNKVLIAKKGGGKFLEEAVDEVIEGWKNQKLDVEVTGFRDAMQKQTGKKLTKGTGYEKYTETNVKNQAKNVKGVKVISEITEKSIELEAIGDFPGGKVQAPDFIVEYNGAKQIWELKYKEARTSKNSAGFINYSQALRDIKAGKEFKLTDRKKTRKNAAEEAIFVESVKEAIENGAAKVEAILRQYKVLKPGQDFTSKTKIPLEIHNIINGKEKASMASSSKIVDGNWVAADYNAKGVHHFQMATKGAFFMGSDPHGMLREAGGTKLEGNFPLMTRVYSSSYKQMIGGKEVTAGYTYRLVGEALISPKNITSVSKVSLDAPGAIKKMANTKAAKQVAMEVKDAKKALAQNNKKVPAILKSKTNSELKRKAKTFDLALTLGRQRNKTATGMSTFDFDETLIVEGQNFITAINPVNGRKVKISSAKWPIEGPKFEAEGFTFDFKDFVNVRGGKEGPLLQKMRNQIKKYGPENVFVLTARMQESAPAINGWLKSKGINIPFENITGLGNSKGEAKAMWMLKKFSEGYNDMYFVDDALPNVKAVKEVLSQLDIKSNVQQVYSKTRDINREVNDIMQHSLDIASNKTFSKAEAKVRGKDIKRRRIFMRDSAADLELLIEPLYGKGKKGNENKKWFKEELVLPFERGIRDYNTARQSAKNDYMALRKQNKDVVKIISKEVEGTSFTNDMAMRVYLWNKAGFKIPDLAKSTETKLVEHVKNNPLLRRYAEKFAQITKQEKGLKEPGENWWAETMAGEVTNIDRGVSRKQYLQEWIDRKNEIFTEQNLNKMESKLGTRWRENITDMFDRMETGRTRSLKLDRGSSAMMNYLNGGIGTIMNFNTRSAALQTISTLNFLNMRENNPISAALAMGNVPQFAKDFMFIMNSDMLKQRRDGLSINVTEAEIASAAASSKNMIQGIIAKVLKVGYTPTKLADSFAISFGGATYYRNRIKMYEKQGMKTKEAEKQAFLDFQVLAERTQQSSRADLLSRQQTTLIGRFVLPFANTPMQMNRAGMKDILDITKGRTTGLRNTSEAIGRITYYMGAQVALFAGLQSALFAMLFNDEDVSEEKIANTKTYTLQSTTDSMLRGFGVQGALLSAFKNAIFEFFKQNKKGYGADYSEVAEDLLNVSPPIGSKFGLLDSAGDDVKRSKDTPFKFELGNQKLEASLKTIQATTNAPVYSPYQNATNLQHALSDQYEMWQRGLMTFGWTPYNVGIEKENKKKKRSKTKSMVINPYQ
jgi:hypothetical protein